MTQWVEKQLGIIHTSPELLKTSRQLAFPKPIEKSVQPLTYVSSGANQVAQQEEHKIISEFVYMKRKNPLYVIFRLLTTPFILNFYTLVDVCAISKSWKNQRDYIKESNNNYS